MDTPQAMDTRRSTMKRQRHRTLSTGLTLVLLAAFALPASAVTVKLQFPADGLPNPNQNKMPLKASIPITWTVEPPDTTHNVKVVLLQNGIKLGTIVDNLPPGTTGCPGNWLVGQYHGGWAAPGTGYAIRVKLKKAPGLHDDSDHPFEILPEKQPVNIVEMGDGGSPPKLSPKSLAFIKSLQLPELEIKGLSRLPDKVCPGETHPVVATITNNGELSGRFHLCTVGSSQGGCAMGGGAVLEIPGHSTRSLPLVLAPMAPYVEDGFWHGKIFLGKVASATNPYDKGLVDKTDGSPPTEPPQPGPCNIGVSTSWTDNPGLAAGALFCDKNMDNHLRILEIPSGPEHCGSRNAVSRSPGKTPVKRNP